jgi:Arc/MetJ family transcription regulator
MIPTRINIDDEALREAMRFSGASTTTEAVNLALREFVARRWRIAALERYAGLAAKRDHEGWMQQRAAKRGAWRHRRVVRRAGSSFGRAAP